MIPKLFQNYPNGYSTIFFTKLLGNFSTYGLRNILTLFLTSELRFIDENAFGVYGTFIAISNLMSILGGFCTDKILGIRQAVLLGGYLIFFGFILLCLTCEATCLCGLSFIAVGIGLFKPSTLSALTVIVPKQTEVQNNFYATLYSGINLGNFLSLIMCGWVGHVYGWKFVFITIGIIMFLGSSIFYNRFKNTIDFNGAIKQKTWNMYTIYLAIGLHIVFFWVMLFYQANIRWIIPLLTILSLGALAPIFINSTNREKQDLFYILSIMIIFVLVCTLLGQTGTSIMLLIERGVDRIFLEHWKIPTLFFQSLNPILVIILGPCMTKFWNVCANKGLFTKFFSKVGIGFLFMSVSFTMLAFSIHNTVDNLIPPIYFIFIFLFQVLGEVCVIPIGLATISKLSPKKFSTTIIGIAMVACSCGYYMAAILANFFSISTINNARYNFISYQSLFSWIALFSLMISFAIIAGSNFYNIHGNTKNKPM